MQHIWYKAKTSICESPCLCSLLSMVLTRSLDSMALAGSKDLCASQNPAGKVHKFMDLAGFIGFLNGKNRDLAKSLVILIEIWANLKFG